MREYYTLWFHLDQDDLYLLWFSNDRDGVLIDENGHIPVFRTLSSLYRYASQLNLVVHEEKPTLHNLDAIEQWMKNRCSASIDYDQFLIVWNMLSDIASSVSDIHFDQNMELTQRIYEKVFLGGDLPTINPKDEPYEPVWSNEELTKLSEVFSHGLALLRSYIQERM